MDVAYDHIQEEILTPEEAAKKQGEKEQQANLNTEFQEAYRSFSASPWGAKLGGFFSDVKKQGETLYDGARSEASAARGEALKGFTDLRQSLVSRARSMSNAQQSSVATPTAADSASTAADLDAKDGTPSDSSIRDSEGMISRFKSEASKRLKDLEKAEEAADAAIFRFGANIGNFLKEAVTIAPPGEEKNKDGSQKFESRDQDGKRVIHSTRFEAQLHAIHTTFDNFTKDPESAEWEKWKAGFDVDKKTGAIASDLEKYDELRRAMERLVPEKVEYGPFWCRYYFLRMVVETDEQRRREMLKGAAEPPTSPIAWDDDTDSETEPETQSSTPQPHSHSQLPPKHPHQSTLTNPTAASTTSSSTTTINPSTNPAPTQAPATDSDSQTLKPTLSSEEPRRSQDAHSQPDSDASYDLVSGATSRAPGSPRREEDEEEEDWE